MAEKEHPGAEAGAAEHRGCSGSVTDELTWYWHTSKGIEELFICSLHCNYSNILPCSRGSRAAWVIYKGTAAAVFQGDVTTNTAVSLRAQLASSVVCLSKSMGHHVNPTEPHSLFHEAVTMSHRSHTLSRGGGGNAEAEPQGQPGLQSRLQGSGL